MCVPLGVEFPIQFGVGLTQGESVSAIGLILDLIGISLITFSGIFGERPIRRLWDLIRNIDRGSLKSDGPSYDLDMTRVIDRPPDHPSTSDPISKGGYDALRRRSARSILGALALFLGLSLQLVGTIIC